MTKQEEIREVIDAYTDDTCLYPTDKCDFRSRDCCCDYERAYKCLMKRLNKLGVVLKVDRELPKVVLGCCVSADDKLYISAIWEYAQGAMLVASYVAVEPLVTIDAEPDCDGSVNCVPYKNGKPID